MSPSPLDRLVRKLESVASLTEHERQAVLHLPITVKEFRARRDIIREGDRPSQCCLILQGFVYSFKMLPDGRRQIIMFYIPGDVPDLQSLHLAVLDHGVATAAPTIAAFIPHYALRRLCRAHPRLADKFWRNTLVDGAIFREWIVNVGRREASSCIAHIFCEVYLRTQAVGLNQENSFDFPLTQGELGDATGVSTVHVNRSLQSLRAESLISFEKGRCTILNWEGLRERAYFDPTYLHLQKQAA